MLKQEDSSDGKYDEPEIKKDAKSFREKWRDPEYRIKFYHTQCICAAFFALGIGAGQMGPTLPDLQILTKTDLGKASAFFTGGSIGFLCGSVLCGFLFSKVNADLLMCLSVFLFGVASFSTPFCSYYELMIFIRFVSSFSSGLVDTGGNALLIRLWGTEGEGLMQYLHFCFATGGVMAPVFSEPFLAPKETNKANLTNGLTLNATAGLNSTNYYIYSTTVVPNSPTKTNVKYAFMITALLAFILSTPFLIFYVKSRKNEEDGNKEGVKRSQRKLPKRVLLITMSIICVFYVTYCCIEEVFASFLMTFLVNEYDSVSKTKGAMATAIFWASFASARFLSIFLCRLFSSVKLLSLCLSLMIITYVSFLISAQFAAINAMLVFSAMAGISMSAVFPAGFSWIEADILRVNGFVSSSILVSGSIGGMINPLILGYLMEEKSNMWFSYLLVGDTIFLVFLFLLLLVFSRFFLNKRYGSSKDDVSLDIKADVSFLNHKKEDENGEC